MKTTLNKVNTVRNRLTVEISVEKTAKIAKDTLNSIKKDISIKGFRKGEVPLDVLEKYLGDDANKEIIKKLVQDTYPDAIRVEKLSPISEPYIEHELYEKDKAFTYHATFDVMPEVVAPDFESLTLEKVKIEVSENEINSGIERIRSSMTQVEPLPQGVISPNTVSIIDFNGTVEGKSFKGSEAKDFVFDYGTMLIDFEKQMDGMKAGEERDVKFVYPKDYYNKDIAGKQGVFKVKVKEIKKKIVPELNDDFAKSVGKYKTLSELKKDIEKQIIQFKEAQQKNQLGDQAIKKIVEKNKIEVPEVMINDELRGMVEDLSRQLKSRGMTLEDAGMDAKTFVQNNHEEASNRVRGYLLAYSIARKEQLNVVDEDINQRFAVIASQTGQPEDKVKEHFDKNNLTERLRSQMLYEKTLDFIVSKAKVKEVKPKKTKKS